MAYKWEGDGGEDIRCPPSPPTLQGGEGQEGQRDNSSWTSYRITAKHTYLPKIQAIFMKFPSVLSQEISKKGVEHYHAVILGYDNTECIKKAISRLIKDGVVKPGKSSTWSKRDKGTFNGACTYTIKQGKYWTYHKFHEILDTVPPYQGTTDQPPDPPKESFSTPKGRHWVLSYSNLLWQALSFRKERKIESDQLKTVLTMMVQQTKWRPSRDLVIKGVDQWYHDQFTWECNRNHSMKLPPQDWMEPHHH